MPARSGSSLIAKMPPVGARQQAVVHRLFVAELAPGTRRLDRVDVADQVRDGHIRRRQFLDVPVFTRQPLDGQVVARRGQLCLAGGTQRVERVVAQLAAGDDGNGLVEQADQRAQHPRLGLATQPEQDEVVLREQGVDDLRHDRLGIADDAGEDGAPGAEPVNEVAANFVFDAGVSRQAGGHGAAQAPEGGRMTGRHGEL